MASAATSLQSSGMIRYSDIRSLLGITSGIADNNLYDRDCIIDVGRDILQTM